MTDALERHRSLPSYDSRTHRLRTISTADSTLVPPALEHTATHTIPGETYIDKDETAGLPGTDIEAFSQERAAQVVQAHKHGLFGHRFGLGFHGRKRKPSVGRGRTRREDGSDADTDVEQVAESSAAATGAPGTGVLSTLLSLYEHDPTSTASGFSTTRSSFDYTDSCATSLYETTTKDSYVPTASTTVDTSRRVDQSQGVPPSPSSLKSPRHPWTTSLPFHLRDKRPVAARSSAGVVGALIASTGNLSGAAAPTNSSLAPEVKRPGYHLSRFVVSFIPCFILTNVWP